MDECWWLMLHYMTATTGIKIFRLLATIYRSHLTYRVIWLRSNRTFIPIHNKKTNWLSTCKRINRYRITRHSGTLPLHFIAQSTLCNHSKKHSIVLSIYRIYHKPKMSRKPLRHNIHSSKKHFPILAAFCLTKFVLRRDFALEGVFIVYEHKFLNGAILCWT
jgi:hypothetical protein